jgi:tetratricopeptide (TPR) repeat protein
LKPDDWEISTRQSLTYYSLAVQTFNEGLYQHTEVYLNDAIFHNPKVYEYFLLRGRSRYYLGDFEGARCDYNEAHRLNPSSTEVHRYYFQFHTEADKSFNKEAMDLSITSTPQLPDIQLTKPIITKKKLKRIRLVKNDSQLALEETRRVVDIARSMVFEKDTTAWKPVRAKSFGNLPELSGKKKHTKTASYSAQRLKEESLKRTNRALQNPGKLLTGVRSSAEDLNYVRVTPSFGALGASKRYDP